MHTARDVGAGLIQCCGEDFEFGGQGCSDRHEVRAPLGAPERGSTCQCRTGRVALHVGKYETLGQDPPVNVPPTNLRAYAVLR
jgi:hypothetical protein